MEKFVEKVKEFKNACGEFGVINICQDSKGDLELLVRDFSKIPNVDGVIYKRRNNSCFPVEKVYVSDGIKIFTFGSIKEMVKDLEGDNE